MQTKVKRRKAKELFIRRCFIVTVSMICILVSILAGTPVGATIVAIQIIVFFLFYGIGSIWKG